MLSGSIFKMWYSSIATTSNPYQIGYATSTDGIVWEKYPTPVLLPGQPGSWDSGGDYSPSVVWNGTTYSMYFVGEGNSRATDIGVAFSSDGTHWQKYAQNPVLTRGPERYDSFYVRYPNVVYGANGYQMWYSGHPPLSGGFWGVDYATSQDGIHWAKFSGNPVVPDNSSRFSEAPFTLGVPFAEWSSILEIESLYIMATEFTYGAISYATSSDGTTWTPSKIPLLNLTASTQGAFFATYPSLVLNSSNVMLWYTMESNNTSTAYATSNIDLAHCPVLVVKATTTATQTLAVTQLSTVTQTSIQTKTNEITTTSTATQTQTSTATKTEIATITQSSSLTSYLEASVVLLAVGLVATALFVVRRRGS
jgi:hypothetical protein